MKSFLIGSLPHKNIEHALRHSFSFDLPTLPNLPNIEPDEFMVDQALSCIDGYIYKGAGLREMPGKVYDSLSFCAADEFFNKLTGSYKWQACGPLTLSSSLDHHPDTNNIIATYLEKIVSTQKLFNTKNKSENFMFFLDEPVLAFCESEIEVLNLFIEKLKGRAEFESATIGVHVCSRVNLAALKLLKSDLVALDPSLYGDDFTEIQRELKERLVYIPVSSKGELINYAPKDESWAAPSCGGALSSLEEIEKIRVVLKKTTLPDHQD